MKKGFRLCLVLLLCVSLLGCGKTEAAETVPLERKQELQEILDGIRDHVQAGTAGCSLRAVGYMARLLDWCGASDADVETVRSFASKWLAENSGEAAPELPLQIELLTGAYKELQSDGARDLLDTAGCLDCGYPWDTEAKELAQAVLDGLME